MKLKRLLAFLLAFVMMFSLTTPAYAEGGGDDEYTEEAGEISKVNEDEELTSADDRIAPADELQGDGELEEDDGTRTITIAIASWWQDPQVQAHYWGEGITTGDVDLAANGQSVYTDINGNHPSGETKEYHLYTAKIPVNAKFRLHAGDTWFGEDSSATNTYAFLFDHGKDGSGSPINYVIYERVDYSVRIGETYYESAEYALTYALDGETVELLKDVELSSTVLISKSIVVDGQGHSVTFNATRGFRVSASDVSVTLRNMTIPKTAEMERAIQVDSDMDGVKLTINNVVASATAYTVNVCSGVTNLELSIANSQLTGWGVVNLWGHNGTVTISDSTLNGVNDKAYNADGWNNFGVIVIEGDTTGQTDEHSSAYTVNVVDSTIRADSTNGNTQAILIYNNPSVSNAITLDGCTIELANDNCVFLGDYGEASVTKVRGTKDSATNDLPVLPEGYMYTIPDADGFRTVVKDTCVARIGSTYFETLQAALDAAHETTGDVTVTLIDDITEVAVIHQKAGLNLTVDGGNKTLTGQIYVDGDGRIDGTETLTIQNINFAHDAATYDGGFINLPNTKTADKVYTTGKHNYAHNITVSDCSFKGVNAKNGTVAFGFGSINGGINNITLRNLTADQMHSLTQMTGVDDVTIEDCTLTNARNGISLTSATGMVTVIGNSIYADETDNGYTFRMKDASSATATLSGNNFRGHEGLVVNTSAAGKVLVTEGYYTGALTGTKNTLVITGGHFSEDPSAYVDLTKYAVVKETVNGVEWFTLGEAVATVTSGSTVTSYSSLESAFAAAQDGDTVTLLKDIELTNRLFVNAGSEVGGRFATTSENKSVTLDLNGKNITSSSNIALAGGSLNITGQGTIKTTEAGLAPIEVRGTGDLASKRSLSIGADVTLEGSTYGLNVFGSNDAQQNAIDVTVNGTVKGTLFVLGNLTNEENDINIVVNGTVTATNGVGVALNGFAKVTVNDGASISGDCGIEARAGELTVNGGTITATAAEFSYVANGDGSATKGAAIAVAQHTTILPTTVTVNGGTLEGHKTIAVTDANNNGLSEVTVLSQESFIESSAIPEDYKWDKTETAGTYKLTAKTYVAKIGDTKFETVAEAVAAAETGDKVEIFVAGTYTLPNLPKNITVEGTVDGVVFKHTTAGNIASIPNGATFKNVAFNLGNVNYHGFQHNGGLTFEGCTFNGRLTSYGTETYKNCSFKQTYSDYHMWVYGGDNTVTYDGCTFENTVTGKFLNVYNENGALLHLIVKDCKFINSASSANKAAINVKETSSGNALHFDVTISGCTLEGPFPGNSITNPLVVGADGLWQVDDRLDNISDSGITVTLEDEVVYPFFVAKIGDVKYETLAKAVEAVPADGTETTITMIDNEAIDIVNYAITIPASKNVVLDLNGFQVVGTATEGNTTALITNKGTLTIRDSSAEGTGKLISGATVTWIYDGSDNYAGSYASNTITNSGKLTVESGYIENLSTGSATFAIDNNSSGADAITIINGGTVKAHSVAIREFANSTTKENSVTVNGGLVEAGYSGIWIQLPGSDATKAMKATLNVTGGEVKGGSYAFYDSSYGNSFDATQYTLSGGTLNGAIFSYGANIEISGGTYLGSVAIKQAKPSEVSVTGGFFDADVYTYGENGSEGYITGGYFSSLTYEYEGQTYGRRWIYDLHPDYKYIDNPDEETKDAYPYKVVPKDYVARIVRGETTLQFESLAEAVAAAQDGDKVELLKDCAGNGVMIPAAEAKEITIDFGGYPYTIDGSLVGSTGTQSQAFHFEKGCKITMQNGKITSDKAIMLVQNYGDLTLQNITLEGSGSYVLSNNNGDVLIGSGTTITAKAANAVAFDVCVTNYYPDGARVRVVDGAVINGNVEYDVWGSIPAENKTALTITGGTFNGEFVVQNELQEAAAEKINISGGNFQSVVPSDYAADGYWPEKIMVDNYYHVDTKRTVSFDSDGGSEVDPVYVADGEPIAAPETVPTKEGYTFDKWMNGSEAYDFSQNVTGDITLTAAWIANPHTVTYKQGNGAEDIVYNISFGEAVTKPADPTREHYNFKGWKSLNSGIEDIPATMPDTDLVFEAIWQGENVMLIFSDGNGKVLKTAMVEYGQTYDVTTLAPAFSTLNPNARGEGWTLDETKLWQPALPTALVASETVVYYLNWIKVHTVTFDADNGDANTTVKVNDGETVAKPADPTREGYTFDKWMDGNNVYDFAKPVSADLTLKAAWILNEYSVTYTDGVEDEELFDDQVTKKVKFGAGLPSFVGTPEREGYTFAGWTPDDVITMPAHDVVFTAQWQVNQYTITFDTAGGSTITPITQNYGTAVTTPADPTKTGYTFTGWNPAVPATMPAENITITAQWEINQYTITFDTDGGTAIAAITQDYNTAVTAPAAPTKTGYTFDGWDTEIPATMPAENLTIKAIWTVNQYTITFMDGETELAKSTQDYGTTVTAPADPTKTGYTFTGWNPAVPATMPAENLTIKAQWEIKHYTVSFDTGSGSTVAPQTVDHGNKASRPADPTKDNAVFGGWFLDGEAYDFETPVTSDLTLQAFWAVAQNERTGALYATVADAFAAAENGDTVKLLGSVAENLALQGGKQVTLNLNGKTLTGSIDAYDYDLTLKGGTLAGTVYVNGLAEGETGKLTLASDAIINADYGIILYQGANNTGNGYTVDINGTVNGMVWVMGNITSGNSVINVNSGAKISGNDVGIALNGAATVNVKDGATVTGTGTGIEVRAGKLNVTGGTITGGSNATTTDPNGSGTTTSGAGIAIAQHTTKLDIEVSISGGTITGTTALNIANPEGNTEGNLTVSVTGGDFTGKVNKTDERVGAFISGGRYSEEPTASYIVPEKCAVQDGEWWIISEAVAQIGKIGYASLEAAVAAANDGETVKLLKDCSGNGIIAPQGKFATTGLTVDFDGHTYTVDGKLVGSTGTESQAFQLLKDNKITFQDGTIYSEKALFLVQNYSDLTLEGMTLTLNNANYTSAYTLSNNNGNVVIENSTINKNPAGGVAFDVCRYSSYPSVHVTVEDSVINGDIEISASGNDPKDGSGLTLKGETTVSGALVIDGNLSAPIKDQQILVVKDNSITLNAPADYKWIDNGNDTVRLTPKDYVAQIGNNKYETLEEAFAAANDGDTITVLKDCSGNGIVAPQGKFTNGLTVDFGGFTYTVDGTTVGSTGTETNGFQLLKDNKITFQNGAITSEKAKILIQNYSDLTLDGMTLTLNNASYTSAYTLSNNNGNVTVKGSTISANPAGGFAFDVCRYSSYSSVSVTVTGASVIDGNIEVYASNSDAKDGFKLLIEAGVTVNGKLVLDASAAAAMDADPDKALIIKENNIVLDAPDAYKWVEYDATHLSLGSVYVAKNVNTGIKYTTLNGALAAANDGETVVPLTNITDEAYILVMNGVTLDLNGHDVTGAKLFYVTGKLIDDKVYSDDRGHFSADAYYLGKSEGSYFPIFDSLTKTYSLYKVSVRQYDKDSEDWYNFRLKNQLDRPYAINRILSDSNMGLVTAAVMMSWTEGSGESAKTVQKTITLSKDLMTTVFNDPEIKTFKVKFTGLDGFTGIQAIPCFLVYDANGAIMMTLEGTSWNLN